MRQSNEATKHLSREDKIEYLFTCTFSNMLWDDVEELDTSVKDGLTVERVLQELEPSFDDSPPDIEPTADDYRAALEHLAELRAKTDEELAVLYAREIKRESQERQERAAAEDRNRFFNEPATFADLQKWRLKAYWTTDEATALCLGRDPRRVNWSSIRPLLKVSPFAVQYKDTRDLIKRAADIGIVGDNERILPDRLAKWVRDQRLPYQLEVPSAQGADSPDTADRQAHFNGDKMDSVATREQLKEIESLKEENRKLQKSLNAEKSARANEKQKLLLILFYAVYAAYQYNPFKSSVNIAKAISEDALHDLGLSISEDTIRRRLGEARELLPDEAANRLKGEHESNSAKG